MSIAAQDVQISIGGVPLKPMRWPPVGWRKNEDGSYSPPAPRKIMSRTALRILRKALGPIAKGVSDGDAIRLAADTIAATDAFRKQEEAAKNHLAKIFSPNMTGILTNAGVPVVSLIELADAIGNKLETLTNEIAKLKTDAVGREQVLQQAGARLAELSKVAGLAAQVEGLKALLITVTGQRDEQAAKFHAASQAAIHWSRVATDAIQKLARIAVLHPEWTDATPPQFSKPPERS